LQALPHPALKMSASGPEAVLEISPLTGGHADAAIRTQAPPTRPFVEISHCRI
jgi:hypothetical protein